MSRVRGNSCLLFLQRISNFALLLVSLAFIGIGTYIIIETKEFSIFPIVFIVTGGIQIFLFFLSCCKPHSKSAMGCYVYVLLIIVGAQLITTGTGVIFKDKILQWAGDNHSSDQRAAQQFEDLIEDNLNIALYVALAASVIEVFCLVISFFYRRSLKRGPSPSEQRLMTKYDAENMYNPTNFNEKAERQRIEQRKEASKREYKARQVDYYK